MILNMSHVSRNVTLVIGPTPPPVYFGMTLHGWVLTFGILIILIGICHALAMEEYLYGTKKYHSHLVKRSFANRVLLTLRENAGGFFMAIPSCLEMEG